MKHYASGKHVASQYTYEYAQTRWRRNIVAAMTTGALVVSSFSPAALSSVALADSSQGNAASIADVSAINEGEPANNEGDVGGNEGIEDEEVEEGSDAGDEGDVAGGESSDADNTNAASNTNAANNESGASNTSASGAAIAKSITVELTDPDIATPNEEFGEPTTSVVIEGSVNGEIMAEIALAEPDGTPEGGEYNKYNYGSGEPWCAYFVMYCARAAGLSTEVIPNYAGCPMLVAYYKSISRWQDFTPAYRPHVGDLIFYSETEGGIASHVGIVTASTDTTVTTREGNTNMGQVATHVFSTTNESGLVGNDCYILGYASPDYPEQVTHEHVNNVASVLNVSDTGHIVTYSPCECGYERPADLVLHNFKSTSAAVKLSEADEWECIDCGAKQTHYTTGIRTTSEAVTVYETDKATTKQLPAGSELAVTNVVIGTDGNYWGVTAEGYSVMMSEAGVKQTSQFAKLNMDDEAEDTTADAAAEITAGEIESALTSAEAIGNIEIVESDEDDASVEEVESDEDVEIVEIVESDEDDEAVEDIEGDEVVVDDEVVESAEGVESTTTTVSVTTTSNADAISVKSIANERHLVASFDRVALGDEATTARWSSTADTVDATCASLIKLQAGGLYVVTVDSVTSNAQGGIANAYLGMPLLKLMQLGEDGSYNVNDMKVYGESGQKLSFSNKVQGFVVAPEEDTTLVVACQGGAKATCNNVTYEGINIYRVG